MGDRKIVSGDSIRVVSWPLGEGQGKVLSFVEMYQQTSTTLPTLPYLAVLLVEPM